MIMTNFNFSMWIACVTVAACVTNALPAYRPKATSLQSTVEYCNAVAFEGTMQDNLNDLTNFRFDMRKGKGDNVLLDDLRSASFSKLTDGLLPKRFLDDTEENAALRSIDTIIRDQLYRDFNREFEKCMDSYYSKSGETVPTESDEEDMDNSEEATKLIKQELESMLSMKEEVSAESDRAVKRTNTNSLVLNPTGWRKRRNVPRRRNRHNNNTDMQHLLHNMHELLMKREKLQFNPTGW